MDVSLNSTPRRSRPGRARTFGVEEEFLLVHPSSGRTMPVAEEALMQALDLPASASALTLEVKQEQLEAVGPVCSTLQELEASIRAGRSLADAAAGKVGARAAALATCPFGGLPTLVQQPRYMDMAARFGLTLREQLTCGFHVHVQITSAEEGVAVLDRIRVWLPLLLALSTNSPFWQGSDSDYASFRYQAWSRWPTAGPTERFGSEGQYRRYVQSLLASGVLVDEGMIYFDARLSRNHPTVEVRIADVCMEASHAAVIAAIVRTLVEQAALEWRAGIPAPRLSADQLRLASWKASESGVDGMLLHPLLNTPCPAEEAFQTLQTHIRPVLAANGEEQQVTEAIKQMLFSGTGARRQREVMKQTGDLGAVVRDAVDRTHAAADSVRDNRRHSSLESA
ncbi:glutamate--cysteine ligase [Paenarthrobacter sp. NPDC089316]|uniref:glutamate--cysteine ligase n=1 Tax=unclassified Paenarthrobacter TaxID=2634190 RepID=UPI00342D290D